MLMLRSLFVTVITLSAAPPAQQFAGQFNLSGQALAGVYLHKEYRTEHNGVTHLVYRQQFQGLDVYNTEYVVNIDRDGKVLNQGGALREAPGANVTRPNLSNVRAAASAAIRHINPVLARESQLASLGHTKEGHLRFTTGSALGEVTGTPVWYPIRGALQPAFVFVATAEDGVSNFETVVDAETFTPLEKQPLTFFQSAVPTPRGLVYTRRSPQPTPNPGEKLGGEPAYVERELVAFSGDPIASPRGWISGDTTAGNNTVTGVNVLGILLSRDLYSPRSPARDFQYPLQLGPGAPSPTTFPDAAAANLFYWVNRIHDLFYVIGFDEAAGNYQMDNFGKGGVGGDPLYAHAHFGAASGSGLANTNNAFYTTRSTTDGSEAMIGMYLGSSPGRWADGAYSTETLFHEYTHGVTFRLVRGLRGHQGGSMNEAFSDFWALEFLTPEGAPPDGIYPYGEYLYNTFGVGIRSRPYSTNMEVNPLTYADLGRAISAPQIHNDGGIWMMALWETRANLIRQFGEREGRRRLRLIVLDGMKLAIPSPSMVDLRDGILLADRVNFRGESQSQIWEAFAKRGLGVHAYSASADSIVVTPSFDRPSNTGSISAGATTLSTGDTVRISVQDGNATGPTLDVEVLSSSGDFEVVTLRRQGELYTGTLFTTPVGQAIHRNSVLSIIHADSLTVFYNDTSDAAGGFRQVSKFIDARQPYLITYASGIPFRFLNEQALPLTSPVAGASVRFQLPFDFPFHDRLFREVIVTNNGLIQLDTGLVPSCTDVSGLREIAAIAPLWMRMRTLGSAQENQGVFVSRAGDSVTFRWAGETAPNTAGLDLTAPVEAINFAATLFDDGRIRFQYGAGNQNLINPQVFNGCDASATAPTAGISRGTRDNLAVPFLLDQRVNFNNAPTATFLPSRGHSSDPVVELEPASEIDDLFQLRGVVYDPATFVSSVNVLIDGRFVGRAATGIPRPDVCAERRLPNCPGAGFLYAGNASALGLRPGRHTLQYRAVNARGGFTNFPETPAEFTLKPGLASPAVAGIDEPAGGATVSGGFTVRGFAYTPLARVTAVDILVDGVVHARARYGLSRPDVCASATSPNCPNAGFLATVLSTSGNPTLTNGPHKLQLRVLDEGGRFTLFDPIPINVDNPAQTPPVGVMTSPLNLERVRGVIRVAGHAYDPDGRILDVTVIVDGIARGTATYGLPRPDVCQNLSNVTACPNIGFEAAIDTRLFTNGLHRIGVIVRDAQGNAITVPRTTNSGHNIYVEN
ncbi:MAG: hypothetical protein FJW30_04865 [Acidobacteria bacterium]|nr:hypothetical protein [Acidobacteriota bacterium]